MNCFQIVNHALKQIMSEKFKLNQLQKWFLLWFGGMVAFCFFTYPDYAPIKETTYSAHIIADRRIYFMNLRRYYYETSTDSASQFNLYTLKKWPNDAELCPMKFVLVDNWLQDEMYIMPSLSENLVDGKTSVTIAKDTFDITNSNVTEWYTLAEACYMAINQQQPIILVHQSQEMQIFKDEESRKAALTVLEDYLKLIRKIS